MTDTHYTANYTANTADSITVTGDLDGVTITTTCTNSAGDVQRQDVSYDGETLDQIDGLIDRLSRAARDIRRHQQHMEEQLRQREEAAS